MLLRKDAGSVAFVEGELGTLRSADGRLWIGSRNRGRFAWLRSAFPIVAAFSDAIALFVTAIATGYVYHYFVFGENPVFDTLYQFGGMIALMVVIANGSKQEYQIASFLTSKGYAHRMFQLWNLIFLAAIALGFLTKTSTHFSRVTIVLYYVTGFAALVIVRSALAQFVQSGSKRGTVSVRRTFLVGTSDELRVFGERYQPWNLGIEIVGVATLEVTLGRLAIDYQAQLDSDLQRAVSIARGLELDDVLILTPWSERELIRRCVDAFLTLPAAIHLGPERIFERFDDVRISKIGPISSLNLVRRPLSLFERLEKRALDIMIASVALIALTPVFAIIAALVRLDSPGPALFRQRRFGFNQKTFHIYKFRTMRTMDDGAIISQARKGDARVTAVGRWLRQLSIDELPQLWNVLTGEMSLVGPRPHALAHDREYERKIALYARRHNVKPGITGWAQVNGFRGETSTDQKMQSRVECDLYYIDNWSIWFDLRILILTLISRKARTNAY